MTSSGIGGVEVTPPQVRIEDWYEFGWWFASQTSTDQAEFLSGMANHIDQGFSGSNDHGPITYPGVYQVMHITDEVQAKAPAVQAAIRKMLVELLERIPA